MSDNIGKLADQLHTIRERKKKAQEKVKEISEQYNEKEKELYNAMKAAGTDKGAGRKANVSITTNMHPSLEDFDQFFDWVKKKRAIDLLSRSVNSAAYRERVENGEQIPGVKAFKKISVNLRTRKS